LLRAGAKPRWMRQKQVRRLPDRCAAAGFFNLHAAVRIAPHDVDALERLCRYVQRPPLSHDRLSEQVDGRLFLKFKRGWDDGTTGVVLTPHPLIARLVAIIPQPRRNLTHYHGVFAPAAKGRADIVPGHPDPPKERVCLLPARVKLPSTRNTPWVPWADLLFRVFDADALACPNCPGRFRVHAVVQGRWATRRVLGCLGRPSTTPRLWSARGPPAAA
jgi:Putative transposase